MIEVLTRPFLDSMNNVQIFSIGKNKKIRWGRWEPNGRLGKQFPSLPLYLCPREEHADSSLTSLEAPLGFSVAQYHSWGPRNFSAKAREIFFPCQGLNPCQSWGGCVQLFNISFSLETLPRMTFIWLAPTKLPGAQLHAKCPARLTFTSGHSRHTREAAIGVCVWGGLLLVTHYFLHVWKRTLWSWRIGHAWWMEPCEREAIASWWHQPGRVPSYPGTMSSSLVT